MIAVMSQELSFPGFLHGSFTALDRGARKLGKEWAKLYLKGGRLPAPVTEIVPRGTVVLTADVSDFERLDASPRWRLYFVRRLRSAALGALPDEEWDAFLIAFDAACLKSSWGALDAAIGHVPPNGLQIVSARIRAVCSFWGGLDTVRYLDSARRVVSLSELLAAEFSGLLQMWSDSEVTTEDIPSALSRALEQAKLAQKDEVAARLARQLANVSSMSANIEQKGKLGDESWLRNWLSTLDDERLESLRAGDQAALRRDQTKLAEASAP